MTHENKYDSEEETESQSIPSTVGKDGAKRKKK